MITHVGAVDWNKNGTQEKSVSRAWKQFPGQLSSLPFTFCAATNSIAHSKQSFPLQHLIQTPFIIRSNRKSRRESNGGAQPSTFAVGRQYAAPVRVDGPLGNGQTEARTMA
eukprot:TRINITY_DN7647_c0_g2_i1.p7 TRINITY_DN7647_c0_g2~~TRINITY_DN7647_c0_g2_i1.p7  ORF type:complete len:111 (+),score=7.01 TRINITY_DN7647_c0_g2_i1:806-1138(+)